MLVMILPSSSDSRTGEVLVFTSFGADSGLHCNRSMGQVVKHQ